MRRPQSVYTRADKAWLETYQKVRDETGSIREAAKAGLLAFDKVLADYDRTHS